MERSAAAPSTQRHAEPPAPPTAGTPARRQRGLAAAAAVVLLAAAAAGGAVARGGGDAVAAVAPAEAIVGPTSAEAKIASAVQAAPAALTGDAAILDWPADGKTFPVLRAGTNRWSCLPDYPVTPGGDPMCVDVNGKAWLDAYMAGKAPKLPGPGIVYMLQGSWDASMTDPFQTEPGPGEDWIVDGPHVSIVGPGTFDAKDYAAHSHAGDTAHPELAAPSVMWAGTPWAHVHVPLR